MTITNFLWDGNTLLQEYDDPLNTQAHYVTEPRQYGSLISQRREGESHHFHFDGLGSTTELTDQTGAVTDNRRYNAFGNTVSRFGTTTFPFQFVGRTGYYANDYDSSYYVRRRVYDCVNTRWLSCDPLGTRRRDINPYTYVRNSAVSAADPDGLGCNVWYDCVLKSETKGSYKNLGKCTCEYICIESTTRARQPVAGGGFTDCEDPKIPKTITHSLSQFKGCKKFLPDISKITGDFAGNARDCSRQKCRDIANKTFESLEEACDAAGQLEEACKAAAALWHELTLEACNACERP